LYCYDTNKRNTFEPYKTVFMSKISAVIITFNEEKYIEQCIRSVAEVADEIVVVDSLSTDKTPEICRTLGARYIEHPFNGYRDQKNFALTQVSFDYVLSLDADEELSPGLEKSILAIKQDLRYDGYKFNRLNSYCGRWIYRANLFPERKIRLFNRKKAHWGGLNIHETVILDNPGSVKYLKGDLLHWLYASYEESVEKMNKYSTLLANEYFKQGIKVNAKKLLFNPLWRFFYSYFLRGGFIDGYDGLVVSRLLAITCFLKYIKLRKLYIQEKQSRWETEHHVNITIANQINDNEEESKPISIGFDAKRAFFNYSGLGNYSRNFLFALAKNHPENSYYLFTPKTKNRFMMENEEQYNLIEPNLAFFKLINPLWRRKYMINDIKRQKLEIFHGLSQEMPLGIEKTGVKSIVTVHDLIFLRFPEFYKWIDAKIYYRKLIHACRVSDHIVSISKQTKNDLVKYLNISPDKISVIYQGCNPYFWNNYSKKFFQEVRTKYNLPERYLLYVGTIEERKNLFGIVKAMHITNINIPLVVIGRKVDLYYKHVLNYITTHKINNIIFAEHISNLELPVFYQNAECFIYPSFFEGFGLPLLEALVSRTPVITSKGGCFAEAAGPGSYYVDPYSPEKIGEAIHNVVNSKELKDKMITIGADYANNFKDDVIANTCMKLYYSLLK
jgi:glycosyltransferase involved in cell wall biosynthesis